MHMSCNVASMLGACLHVRVIGLYVHMYKNSGLVSSYVYACVHMFMCAYGVLCVFVLICEYMCALCSLGA